MLDSFKGYIRATGATIIKLCRIDIRCASQAIDTLYINDRDPENLELALNVPKWTIDNMQDRTDFYYRRYSPWLVSKALTLY